jgi:hypothetical protein
VKLVEARADLHRIAERKAQLALCIRRGELIARFAVDSASFTFGRRQRDLLLNLPARYGAILAVDFGVAAPVLLQALDRIMRLVCYDLAGKPARAPPPPPPPEPPIVDPTRGYFPATVDSAYASVWRMNNPKQAAQWAEYQRRLDAYNAKWGTEGQGAMAHG